MDSNGEWIEYFVGEQNAVSLGNWTNNLYNNNSVARYALDHPFQTGTVAAIAGGAITAGGVILGGGRVLLAESFADQELQLWQVVELLRLPSR